MAPPDLPGSNGVGSADCHGAAGVATGMEIALLRRLFASAVRAADPRHVLPVALPEKPAGRRVVVGAGKSAALMAQAVDQAWPDVALSGVVATRYGHAVPAGRIAIIEAGHPVLDAASEQAACPVLQPPRNPRRSPCRTRRPHRRMPRRHGAAA